MIIGVPKEVKPNENRVALLPTGVSVLKAHGHKILVERGAGIGSGFDDKLYESAGAEMVDNPEDIYANADMIVKVKEPVECEYKFLRKGQVIFTYFHFAANRQLTEAVMRSGCIAIAYETVQRDNGELPLLEPMSEIAGRMAPQEGAKYLEKPMGGRGILLGGVPGVEPADVAIIGGGTVGTNAAKIAAGLGARVTILDINIQRLKYLDDIMPRNVITMASNEYNIMKAVKRADVLIGAVLIPGAKAPKLVTREMVAEMKEGSVVVDVSIDQGGCIETCRPTTHDKPTYVECGVVHYCVTNMPGAVPKTSTIALTNVTLPYILELANKGFEIAVKSNRELRRGVNIIEGKITHTGVADAFNLPYTPVEDILN
jgi:alanine dehydrogenase